MEGDIVAIEFFSGIGGLHYGLELAVCGEPIPGESNHPDSSSIGPQRGASVVAAFDINTIANLVYHANFGLLPSVRAIDVLTAADLAAFPGVNTWLLSPPCQPFTAGGKSLDDKDERSRGLLRLIELLGEVPNPPDRIFLENVPNFERSRCRDILVQTLVRLGYRFEEYLVSPMQCGIPNDRRRYYIAAKRETQSITPTASITGDPPPPVLITTISREEPSPVAPLSRFLEQPDDITPFLMPEDYILKRKDFRFDFVTPDSRRTSTITKSYGSHMVTRAGSFLRTANLEAEPNFDDTASLLQFKVRFLTPVEIARLHAFPVDEAIRGGHGFSFPEDVSLKQRWRLLGNSLNCRVVGLLMRRFFF
ncbi:S-adenosyl-L-methionine-dependent methyltransferase [Zopfochytrium polystomum]|nr:S-adenosyl-L-methionine-dependent methyltransferase [Zopfochytrium polystomum]